jgi:hypothetical protein
MGNVVLSYVLLKKRFLVVDGCREGEEQLSGLFVLFVDLSTDLDFTNKVSQNSRMKFIWN